MNPDILSSRLGALRTKRDALLASPSAPGFFGQWWGHFVRHHDRWGRASPAEVADMEAAGGFRLPEDYRRFITEIADGGLAPGCGMFSLKEALDDAPEWTGDPHDPFCCGDEDAQRLLARRASGEKFSFIDQPHDDGLPRGSLLLTHTGCGCFDILVVTGEQRGTVWFFDTRQLAPYSDDGRQLTFLDWYSEWLDACLERFSIARHE